MNINYLSMQFFLQMAVILIACRVVGKFFSYFGQPQVVGEMITGVILGPSLLGQIAPETFGYIFPAESKNILSAVSQLGLVFYMFLIGMEFDLSLLNRKIKGAVSISLAGIICPFILGGISALFIYKDVSLFNKSASAFEAFLFIGAAMSITAFPMLARIIREKGLSCTSFGAMILAAGSLDDFAAWGIFSIVLASFKSDPYIVVKAIGGGILFILFSLYLLKPYIWKKLLSNDNDAARGKPNISFVLILLMLGAWFTDYIGMYSIFGAFILGTSIPRGKLTEFLDDKLSPLTASFFLPVFFVYSGLNTKINLINTPQLWLISAMLIFIAVLGKGVASFIAAKLNGESMADAIAIGSLMNSRGLMELIILNLGLQFGIILPTLFSIMTLMAIVTTVMAYPIFNLAYKSKFKQSSSRSVAFNQS